MEDPRLDDFEDNDFEDMVDNAPCGYVTLLPNSRVSHVNKTLLGWTGYSEEQVTGKRFTDFLNMAGRIYYETHIAPLLRMQGSFNGFAIDMVSANGEPLQMISSAAEKRDANGRPCPLALRLYWHEIEDCMSASFCKHGTTQQLTSRTNARFPNCVSSL